MTATVQVKLLSMPWALPLMPSIQTGALKAYLDRECPDLAVVSACPAHLAIPVEGEGGAFIDFWNKWAAHGEKGYLLAYARAFGLPDSTAAAAAAGLRLEPGLDPAELSEVTGRCLESDVLAHLDEEAINVVGFTCNFDQVYASLFAQRYIESRFPRDRLVFLYGGMSMVSGRDAAIMNDLGIDAFCVMGEGEERLRRIVEICHSASGRVTAATRTAIAAIPGVFHVSDPPDLLDLDRGLLARQVGKLESLPLPDYDSYFGTLRALAEDEDTYKRVLRRTSVMMEGTRGCFAKCDFCGLNNLWNGFRTMPARDVADRTRAVSQRHGVRKIMFVDNVCDTWAEEFADILCEEGPQLESFMELRAHHPDTFFARLYSSGVREVQIGIECISPPLLKHMRKGTTVVQNLLTKKFLVELGINVGANLITHHPKSTAEDARITRSIIEKIPHLGRFGISPFAMVNGSPLFNAMSREDRATAVAHPLIEAPHPALDPYMIDWRMKVPEHVDISRDVRMAWDEFWDWYMEFAAKADKEDLSLRCFADGRGNVTIIDRRHGRPRTFELSGHKAAIYELGHKGTPRSKLALAGVAEVEIDAHIADLAGEGLMLLLDEQVISLALRPKERLLAALTHSTSRRGRSTHHSQGIAKADVSSLS